MRGKKISEWPVEYPGIKRPENFGIFVFMRELML